MRAWLWLLLSLLVSATTWVYTHRVLVPWEYQVNVKGGRVIAQMGDLYPRWVGTRDLLLHGQNPYGPEVSHEIQMAFYGHPIIQSYNVPGVMPVDEQRFAYPVYVVFLLAPIMQLPFDLVQKLVEILLALLTAAGVLLWLDFSRWRPSRVAAAAIILLVLNSPQVVQGLRYRQLTLLVGFLLAVAAWCVRKNYLTTAGAALAVSTIKPQMVLLVLIWFLLWAASKWRARWPLLAGFGGTLGALAGAGWLLLPHWVEYFLDGLTAYRKYVPLMSLFEVALGKHAGDVVAGIVIAILLVSAWKYRGDSADSAEFSVMLVAFFLVTTLTMPLLPPFNQVMLILPVFLLLRDWRTLAAWQQGVLCFCLAWPGVASLGVWLFSNQLRAPSHLVLLPSFVTPLFPFILSVLIAAWNSRLSTASAV